MSKPRISLRSRVVAGAVAAAIAAVSFGPAALASGHRASRTTKADAPAGPTAAGTVARDAAAAVQRLVPAGVIDQAQAEAVGRQVQAGSVDPQALVRAGTVTAAQMAVIAHAIDQVKFSAER